MRSLAVFVAVACLVGLSSGQVELPQSVDEALAKANEIGLKNIDLKAIDFDALAKNLTASGLPLGEAENVLKKKCEKNGGKGSYEVAKRGTLDLHQCLAGLINVTQLQEEMAEARPKGDLDVVFKKYCMKKPILKGCITNFTAAIDPCLEPIERDNEKIVHSITDKILNFVCFKEGDRIALFVAAKGPECFKSKAMAIGNCANQTYSDSRAANQLPFDPSKGLDAIKEIKELPRLVFDDKTCTGMDKLQSCVVRELEGCEDPTPANLLDSIFNYIKKVTPCQKMLADMPRAQAQTMENSATRSNAGVLGLLVMVLVALY